MYTNMILYNSQQHKAMRKKPYYLTFE